MLRGWLSVWRCTLKGMCGASSTMYWYRMFGNEVWKSNLIPLKVLSENKSVFEKKYS